MKIENIQRRIPKPLVIHIRITKDESKFMTDKNISPSLLFREALNEFKKRLE